MEVFMARTHYQGGRRISSVAAAALVLGFLTSTSAAEAPRLGDVQKLKVITISMQVSSTEKESKQVTYTPPPGWYVRSHYVECTAKSGNSSYSVHTLPQNWKWLSEDRINDSYKLHIDLAAQAQNVGLQAKLAQERARMMGELHRVRSTHHALVVEATAKGEGFWKGGGTLQLSVFADLVYVGTNDSLESLIALHRPK